MTYADSAEHVCHLYQGNGLEEVALRFLHDGLHSGACCLYVAGTATVDDWYQEIQAYGIDLHRALRDGALDVLTGDTWRHHVKRSSVQMAREVLAVMGQKLREFSAVCIAGDVDWSSDPAIPADVLCHWEATANLVFEGSRARVLCQYNIDRYPPAFIIAALRTHPVVLYEGHQVDNPFYEAPRILRCEPRFNHNSNDADVLAGMLRQLQPSIQFKTASRSMELKLLKV